MKFNKEELIEALDTIHSIIVRCEKSQLKCNEGTSQHTLLKNRLKAMYISNSLLMKENVSDKYTKEELQEALLPVLSIIHKCEKAQAKYEEGTSHYNRFQKMINAMQIAKALITNEIC